MNVEVSKEFKEKAINILKEEHYDYDVKDIHDVLFGDITWSVIMNDNTIFTFKYSILC